LTSSVNPFDTHPTMATSDQVQSLYIAYFGRPADSEGLKYWTADSETPLTEIADGFAATAEYKSATAGQSDAQVINSFYNNLFNRNAEVEGLNFWLNEIALGKTTVQEVGVVIGQEAVNASPANDDTSCITNKFTAASQWTADTAATTEGIIAYSGAEGIAAGVSYMDSWGATAPTAEETQAAVDILVSDNSTGDSLNLSIFQDVADSTGYTKLTGNTVLETSGFKLDATNQVVNAAAGTLGNPAAGQDILDDSSTSDADVLNVSLNANNLTAGASGATLVNIETVNFEVTNYGVGTVTQALNINGTKTFSASGNLAAAGNLTLAGSVGSTAINVSGLTLTGTNTTAQTSLTTVGSTTVTGFVGTDSVTTGGDGDTINLGAGDNLVNVAGNHTATVVHDTTVAGTVVVAANGTDTVTLTASVVGATVNSGAAVNTTVNASTSSAAVALNGDGGNDTLTGGSGADTVTTGGGTNTVNAGTGNDTVTGGGGADTLNGEESNDVIDGGAANDTINGGTGVDNITGGTGLDVMTGGTGADTFVYTANSETILTAGADINLAAGTLDTITDFTIGTDLVGFTNPMPAGGGQIGFGAVLATMGAAFADDTVSVITLDGTTVAGSTVGAAAAAGNAALLVFNTSGGAITSAGNSLVAANLGIANLQIIGLEGQAGVNYGTMTAADFNFAA